VNDDFATSCSSGLGKSSFKIARFRTFLFYLDLPLSFIIFAILRISLFGPSATSITSSTVRKHTEPYRNNHDMESIEQSQKPMTNMQAAALGANSSTPSHEVGLTCIQSWNSILIGSPRLPMSAGSSTCRESFAIASTSMHSYRTYQSSSLRSPVSTITSSGTSL